MFSSGNEIFFTGSSYVKPAKRVHCRREIAKTRARTSWTSMKQRCLNPKNQQYKDYGGRGIGVCGEWLLFDNFYRDMGERAASLELDRIDNEKGYCKENCRWVTRKVNANNRTKFRANNKRKALPRGVSAAHGKFMAYIFIEGTRYHIGMYPTIETASEAFKITHVEWYGHINFRSN